MTLVIPLLQIAVILAACRLLHAVAGRFGQPSASGLVLFMFLIGLHLDLVEVYALRNVAGLGGREPTVVTRRLAAAAAN